MGYELESTPAAASPELDVDRRYRAIERRWRLANEQLAAALVGYRTLRGRLAPGDPAWLAAQLHLAQTRQRCREASDELEHLDGEAQSAAQRR